MTVDTSSEALDLARHVEQELERDAETTLWTGIFGPSTYTLEAILGQLPKHDFGIFLLSPDDFTTMRGQSHSVARDNVILELGVYFGAVGRLRTFFLVPRGETIHLPSDLFGVTPVEYDASKSGLHSILSPACSRIRDVMRQRGRRRDAVLLNTEEQHFKNAYIHITDFTRTKNIISEKEFEHCIIDGPAVVYFLPGTNQEIRDCTFDQSRKEIYIAAPEGIARSYFGLVGVQHCYFTDCLFRRISIFATADDIARGLRGIEDMPPSQGRSN